MAESEKKVTFSSTDINLKLNSQSFNFALSFTIIPIHTQSHKHNLILKLMKQILDHK